MTKKQENKLIVITMSLLGSRRSDAKTKAARENGKKGGRGNKKVSESV